MIRSYYNSDGIKIIVPDVRVDVRVDYGTCPVDLSGFRPSIDGSTPECQVSGSDRTPIYDFEDGVDNGDRSAMYLRNKGLDRTEREVIAKRAVAEAKSSLEREIAEIAKNSVLKAENAPADGITSTGGNE